MDTLLLTSIAFLSTVFCIIAGFVVKLWIDERNSQKNREALISMGLINDGEGSRNRNLSNENDEDDEEEEEEAEYAGEESYSSDKKIGKKKLAKLQAKAEARALREQEQAEREEKKRRAQEIAKQEEEKRILEEEEEKKRAEQLRLEKEEREKRELEEYMKLKATFEVEEQGYDNELEEEDEGGMIERFISFIKQKKVVHIDELASHFSIKASDVVRRIETFLGEKRITGVFDERGLFTHISEEELQNVAKFINQRGRVNLLELVEHSQRLVSLMPPSSLSNE